MSNDSTPISAAASWDDDGTPENLLAAAEDADKWLELIQRLHDKGRGPWKFSNPESAERLRNCRASLRHYLTGPAT